MSESEAGSEPVEIPLAKSAMEAPPTVDVLDQLDRLVFAAGTIHLSIERRKENLLVELEKAYEAAKTAGLTRPCEIAFWGRIYSAQDPKKVLVIPEPTVMRTTGYQLDLDNQALVLKLEHQDQEGHEYLARLSGIAPNADVIQLLDFRPLSPDELTGGDPEQFE